jgi:hypothetical protein
MRPLNRIQTVICSQFVAMLTTDLEHYATRGARRVDRALVVFTQHLARPTPTTCEPVLFLPFRVVLHRSVAIEQRNYRK